MCLWSAKTQPGHTGGPSKDAKALQDMIMELCCVVTRHAPVHGIGTLLPEMLTIELSGWDALMIGLRALLTMLLAAPAWSRGGQQPTFEVLLQPHAQSCFSSLNLDLCPVMCQVCAARSCCGRHPAMCLMYVTHMHSHQWQPALLPARSLESGRLSLCGPAKHAPAREAAPASVCASSGPAASPQMPRPDPAEWTQHLWQLSSLQCWKVRYHRACQKSSLCATRYSLAA